ncbi:unnamed protein product, partial [Timema podura]|nr:unnamed protein product [Timema podura]
TSSGSVVTSSGDVSAVTRFIRTLITPIFAIYNYVWSLVFGRGVGSPAEAQTQRNKRKEPDHTSGSQSNIPSEAVKRRNNLGETKVARREGNIHRLTNRDSSDDENNTWNGNSTQQMWQYAPHARQVSNVGDSVLTTLTTLSFVLLGGRRKTLSDA